MALIPGSSLLGWSGTNAATVRRGIIELGRGESNGLHRPAAVANLEERLGRQTLGPGPAAPLRLYVGLRVHQHPVEVEENRATFEAFHGRGRLPANFDPVRAHA